jgi:hypothetical protein
LKFKRSGTLFSLLDNRDIINGKYLVVKDKINSRKGSLGSARKRSTFLQVVSGAA